MADGTIFELAPGGDESVLYSFGGGEGGTRPTSGVVMDGAGNLYGTLLGTSQIFKLAPDGTASYLWAPQ